MSTTADLLRFTTSDYQRIAELGLFENRGRVELIDGSIRLMSPIGPSHWAAVSRLSRLLFELTKLNAIISIQSTIQLNQYNSPEPDVAIVKFRDDFYQARLPGPIDILLLIEISDTSLDFDLGPKKELYAASGIKEYWVVDLINRQIIQFSDPVGNDYSIKQIINQSASVQSKQLPELQIAASQLFV